ncbi:MAG TPA: hypothetical protein VD886_16810, partial [Herpetosiphonaceae bacterium]|nr:hypothetical protein [Herpetosiphonaceae bacterium]
SVEQKLAGEPHSLRYEPGETSDAMFGGNSNWRGPIWAPLNHLLIEALHHLYAYFGADFRIAGVPGSLDVGARQLVERLISLFRRDPSGRRPFFGDQDYFQSDPHWRDALWFFEHFHPESGAGLGASHQNGWTALIARLLHDEGRSIFTPCSPASRGEA